MSTADVVIVHWGPSEPTVAAATAALATGWPVTVVDNDGALPLAERPGLSVERPGRNVGFARGVNLGAHSGQAPWILVLNPDTEADPDDLRRLVAIADDQDALGVLAPSLAYLDGAPQITGGSFSGWVRETARVTGAGRHVRAIRARARREARPASARPATLDRGWVSGAAMLVRRSAFEAVGGFDERFFLYYEDEDLCRRIRARGWRVAVAPEVCVRHAVQGTSGGGAATAQAFESSRALYHRIHSGPVLRRVVSWDSARRTKVAP